MRCDPIRNEGCLRFSVKNADMRVLIQVHPGASSTKVGGARRGALAVRVVEPADRGRATAAALKAVADELGVPRRCVKLVSGASSRRKLIDIEVGSDDEARAAVGLARLLARNNN